MASLNVNTSIVLNVARPNSNVVIYAKQFDKLTRTVDVSLLNGTSVWDPPQDCEVVVMCFKPDGTKAIYDVANSEPYYDSEKTYSAGDRVRNGSAIYSCNADIDTPEEWTVSHWTYVSAVTPAMVRTGTGKYRLSISDQALSAAGNVLVEISFYTTDLRATTLSFMINVEKSVPDNETMVSSDYFNVLTGLIQSLLGSTVHSPYIDPTSRNWMTWDDGSGTYVDSGYSSVGIQGIQGERGFSIASITRVNQTPAYPGEVNTYRVNLDNGESAGTFQVREGQDGLGAPGDMDPLPNGEASPGTANAYSRQDHVHPVNVTQAIFDAIYPIGSIYMSMNPTSPSLLFGGDWVKLEDYFLFAAGDIISCRDEGGSTTTVVPVSMPAHTHNVKFVTYKYNLSPSSGQNINSVVDIGNASTTTKATSSAGSGSSTEISIMPPYLGVYMGERVQLIDYDNNMAFVKGNFYVEAGDTNIYRCDTGSGGQIATASLSTYVGSFLTVVDRW